MEGISDIKICGMDETRPPMIKKEPYIDLNFKLIHKAPKDWCNDFNMMASKDKSPAKIDPEAGLFIETWVRKPEEIEKTLDVLKTTITNCNNQYIERINAASVAAAANQGGDKPKEEGPQGQLNKIITALNYDDEE